MLTNKRGFFLITGLLLLFGVSACEQFQLCAENSDLLTVRFAKEGEGHKMAFHRIVVPPYNSTFKDTVPSVEYILPLNPIDTQTTMIFERYASADSVELIRDTLSVSYRVSDSLQSTECGVLHLFDDFKAGKYTFAADSVWMRTAQEDNNLSKNEKVITIYLSTESAVD